MSKRNIISIVILFVITGNILAQETGDLFAGRRFPVARYVPFGYLNNPWHSYVNNRSGILRTVPPVGMGYWATSLPWSYATRMTRQVNYLSFLHLGFSSGGKALSNAADFACCNLHSSYHTKNVMRYDWDWDGVSFSASYYLLNEHALACRLEMKNTTRDVKNITAHVTHEYGHIEQKWWGSTGITSRYDQKKGLLVDKLWEYGDVFVVGAADAPPVAMKATADENEWQQWIKDNNLASNTGASIEFHQHPALYAMQSYPVALEALAGKTLMLVMARGTNQQYATKQYEDAQHTNTQELAGLLGADDRFYEHAPRLEGDWPQTWKNGWVYDFETLRMTVRPPCGIYRHPWDGMQIYAPRAVLGETALDMLCIGYADIELAKKVLYGVFADAPAANVPCTREDGSMNMIGSGGAECGTSPVWGLPFSVIYSVYQRSGDVEWLQSMYPYMKSFVDWWLANRTDKDGWFHCNNSWESGQDGSKRFTFDGGGEGDVSDFVRTVDVEAAMADAMLVMSRIASVAGYDVDARKWETMAKDRIKRMRTMFHGGWFRDVDGRNGRSIMLDTYNDVMMLLPLTVGLATEQQVETITPKLRAFIEGDSRLVWPPGIFFYTEAMYQTNQRELGAELIVSTGNRIYERMSATATSPTGRQMPHLPQKYNYRIPGVSNEFWPVDLEKSGYGGAEQYGWGATLPAMVIRSLFGFTESPNNNNEFLISPFIPDNLPAGGKRYGISNLNYRNHKFTLNCSLEKGRLLVDVTCTSGNAGGFVVKNSAGKIIARSSANIACHLKGKNGEKYTIQINP